MKKFCILLFSLILFSFFLHPMQNEDENTPREMNTNKEISIPLDYDAINNILKVSDPVKFNALAQKFVIPNYLHNKAGFQAEMTKEEKLRSLQDSMSKIRGLNTGLLEELDELGTQSLQQCNRARQRGGFYAFAWFVSTGVFLGIEGYLLFQELSTEAKVMSGVTLLPAAYGTVTKFLDNVNKIINNTHINEKIEKQTAKIEALASIKYGIAKDITSLNKEIILERKNRRLFNVQDSDDQSAKRE